MSEIDEFLSVVKSGFDSETSQAARRGATPTTDMGNSDWAKSIAAAACWARTGDSYFPVSQVENSLPPGAYNCRISNTGPYLEKMKITIDHLLQLPDTATEVLLEEFSKFWKLRKLFDDRGFTFKRGMLMWGPPGSGKTSAIWQMAQLLIKEHNGVLVFIQEPQVAIWCLTALRRIEPNRPVVTVSEDLDALVSIHGEHHLLALFDGEFQLDNVVHLATTNYPDRLDKRFIDRPSRFDTIMKVGMPSEKARRVYLSTKEPELDISTLERWVERSEGYSVAHLREVCIAIQCLRQPEDEVFFRLDKMRQLIRLNSSGDDEQTDAGFLAGVQLKLDKKSGFPMRKV